MRTIKIKRGVSEPQVLLDGELGYDIGNKTLYIGNGGGKDLLFAGGSVYPKIHADYNYYKKTDKNATEGYLGLVNGKIPTASLPVSMPGSNNDEIYEVDYVYLPGWSSPGTNRKRIFYTETPFDFAEIAPGVELGVDINGDEFETQHADGITYLAKGADDGEYHLMRQKGPSATPTTLQSFTSYSDILFICRYDGHVYRISVEDEGRDCYVEGLSTPPDVIDGGSW